MNSIYICLTVFLFVLAIFDLMVGVSNDAVNFLNSAVGSKLASFKTIIIVASAGVFLGAATSNGMMEIARNGIVHPSFFSYREMMVIFVAVMVSDVLLLDIFNSLGMPTSTTVSMVFELMGGAFAISLMKTHADPSLNVGMLINSGKAISMIGAIFISVAIAFVTGLLIQYLSRLIFTFAYKDGLKWKIGIFGGLCATAIIYFMIIKGLGKSTLMPADVKSWIMAHQGVFLLATFGISTAVMQIVHMLKCNVFRFLVLMGTFALAMAFAGNDLVNFIGVPLAGFAATVDFAASGDLPDRFMMSSLDSPAKVPVYFLLAAGAIMVASLATSRKARNVIRTSVDLSRQDSGDELFGSSKVARVLVRKTSLLAGRISAVIPRSVHETLDRRFDSSKAEMEKGAAFDAVRATVNLVVASLLIALGTSLKLPLSTTYVTFMVAMGTSLADRAWGRESAVFRITGVMAVIGGWFITAGAAFLLCFCVAMLMFYTGNVGTIVAAVIALAVLISGNLKSRKKVVEEKSDVIFSEMMSSTDETRTLDLLSEHIRLSQIRFLDFTDYTYRQVTDGFMLEDLKMLNKAESAMRSMRTELKSTRRKEMMGLRRVKTAAALERNTWFHLSVNSCEEMLYSLRRVNDACQEHIDNNFVPLDAERRKEFAPLRDKLNSVFNQVKTIIEYGDYASLPAAHRACIEADKAFSICRHAEMSRIQTGMGNITTEYVYLNMIQESQQLVISLRHLLRAADHFATGLSSSNSSILLSSTE